MAHTKSGGSTTNLRDSQPKYLGVKLYAGEVAHPGNVIIRQRGTRVLAGEGVRVGHDHTLYASKHGVVQFGNKRKTRFDGKIVVHKIVSVVAVA
ncbi:MAG: 50S ribosomal protein L27 [Candidatus Ryanbacteria bacterium RIFCSPHIGHO2_02_FULL_48_12]|uniref:Large ribosomal subunit protein bL27 n=1 Tax=Candidatus Ryanbacteria bacterium RIFCSPHIGHO2_01_FULL_48_27 TaxID=1802115 RepID=A0A1G2G341_9BACT|nr:MAG: 50S ribosomal protein L27 [Candidatus Ryanbacteria bacterium RIFCSPHIGHO2_01_FULL_48_27]OGZ49255.1 MAG: 50S ribosomal protein L27 [Candidatus Ryanbacteria bacterium RIFCSPHIGHO2_02_FULL_48_12]